MGTGAVENQFVVVDLHAVFFFHQTIHVFILFKTVEVHHRTAGLANEMGVGFYHCVKALLSVDGADAGNHPFFLEARQIAIDCAQTEIGILRFQLLLYPVGTGVLLGRSDLIQNGFAFFAVSGSFFHGPSLHAVSYCAFSNNNNYYLQVDTTTS